MPYTPAHNRPASNKSIAAIGRYNKPRPGHHYMSDSMTCFISL